MKIHKYLLFAFIFSLLHFCSKKTEITDFTENTEQTKDSASYERGLVNDGEILDVNFDPTLIGAFSTQTEKKLDLNLHLTKTKSASFIKTEAVLMRGLIKRGFLNRRITWQYD